VTWFSSLGLFDEIKPSARISRRNRHFEESAERLTVSARGVEILLVGLGELGLSVLKGLIHVSNIRIRLFDPVPVQWFDIDPFYRSSELHHDKTAVVWRSLGAAVQERVQVAKREEAKESAFEDDLRHNISEVHLVVCCMDQPSSLIEKVFRICNSTGVPFIPAEITENGGSVGPVFTPQNPRANAGCWVCASLFRAQNDAFSKALLPYLERRFPLPARWRYPHGSSLSSVLATYVVLAVLETLANRNGPHPNDSKVLKISANAAEANAVATPRHYACSRCFVRAGKSVAQLRGEAKHNWESLYRSRLCEPTELRELWRKLSGLVGANGRTFQSLVCSGSNRQFIFRFFVDRGVEPRSSLVPTVHSAFAERHAFHNNEIRRVGTEGVDFLDARSAQALAVVEGLERLFALEYYEPERVIYQRYREISDFALDPRSFPLFDESQYENSEFRLRRFSPDETIGWICGTRMSDDESIFVPMDLIYGNNTPSAIYVATSNGAACHSSFHHAVLNGIYETIERDALMLVWLNRMSLPVLEFADGDPDPFGVRKDFQKLSFELTHVDVTTDLNVPVMLAVLRDKLNPDFFVPTMASSLRRNRILEKLYKELIQFSYTYFTHQRHHKNERSGGYDTNGVTTFADHLSFYQDRNKNDLVSFLTAGTAGKSFPLWENLAESVSVTDELDTVHRRLLEKGYEVIVVDCTTQFLKELGLYAVKVLIPGLQALNANHLHRALGGRRPFTVARLMGFADRDRTIADLSPWPHPFW
jgi:ribosomal protein S12 methylthiotransferase accessory factor